MFVLGSTLGVSLVHAQAFPARPVTIVNPYPAGGGADNAARLLAKELSEEWKQPVLVENKPGAGTTIAAAFVARAPADGYTLLLSSTQHAIAPAVFKRLPYNYLTSLTPIAIVTDSPFFLVVRPDRGINSVNELVAELKKSGSTMNYGSSGPASLPHLAGALLNQLTDAKAAHIPYAGTAPALTGLLGGQVDYMFADNSVIPNIQAGKVKAIAVSSAGRSPVFPNVPSMNEAIGNFELTVWTGLEAPEGTPPSVVAKINEAVYRALKLPAMVKAYADSSRQVVTVTPPQFAEFKSAEVQKYQRIAKEADLKAE